MKITNTDINTLADIYEAVAGLVSETGTEEFDHFYSRGGEQMINDFESVLDRLGVKLVAAEPAVGKDFIINNNITAVEEFLSDKAAENRFVFRKQADVDNGVYSTIVDNVPDVACGHWYQNYSKSDEFSVVVHDNCSDNMTQVVDFIINSLRARFGMKYLSSKDLIGPNSGKWLKFKYDP